MVRTAKSSPKLAVKKGSSSETWIFNFYPENKVAATIPKELSAQCKGLAKLQSTKMSSNKVATQHVVVHFSQY
jgi:hypothetical protein